MVACWCPNHSGYLLKINGLLNKKTRVGNLSYLHIAINRPSHQKIRNVVYLRTPNN